MKKLLIVGGAATAGLLTLLVVQQFLVPIVPPASSLSTSSSSNCTVAAPAAGGDLDGPAVAAIAYRAGWRGDDIDIAVAVAKAESGWRPDATLLNTNGSTDHGLFQINSIHAAILAGGDWSDPEDNAAMAFKVWTQAGGKWSPWVTYWRGTYKQYLGSNKVDCVPDAPVVLAGNGCGKAIAKGYPNGRIPDSALCPLWADSRHKLRADAAQRFDSLAKAYAEHFGYRPNMTDSYRSLAAQISVARRKPGLAAKPGTSNHGWGMALDMCSKGCGQWIVGSDYDVWMHQNAPKYGWIHPDWAEPNGSRPEPWHWECSACGAK